MFARFPGNVSLTRSITASQKAYGEDSSLMSVFEASRANARQQAANAIGLNITLGGDVREVTRRSIHEAVETAIIAHERGILRALVDYLCDTAEDLDAEEDPDEESLVFDGVACLLYAAMDLEEGIPMEDRATRTE